MNLLEIKALLRRHLFAVIVVCILAIGVTYSLEHANPGYEEAGTVVITGSPAMEKSALYTYANSLLAMQDLVSVYMSGPGAEHSVRAAGGAGSYSVTLVNNNNEELPYYKNPYVNIVTSSPSAGISESTFTAVVSVLTKEVTTLQVEGGIASNEQIAAILSSRSGAPVSQRGSRVRSLAAIAILTIIVVIMSAYALDRKYRYPRSGPALEIAESSASNVLGACLGVARNSRALRLAGTPRGNTPLLALVTPGRA